MITRRRERTRALRRRGQPIGQPGHVRLSEIFRDIFHVRNCTPKSANAPCLRRVLTVLAWPGRPRVGVGVGLCSIRGQFENGKYLRLPRNSNFGGHDRRQQCTSIAGACARNRNTCAANELARGQRTNGSTRATHKVLSHSGTLRTVFTL